MPFILIRRCCRPFVMGISYMNSYCFIMVLCYALNSYSPLVLTRWYGHFMEKNSM